MSALELLHKDQFLLDLVRLMAESSGLVGGLLQGSRRWQGRGKMSQLGPLGAERCDPGAVPGQAGLMQGLCPEEVSG